MGFSFHSRPPEDGGEMPTDAVGMRHAPAQGRIRIVSLVPSITELLFALDLGTQVVGCTTYCIHPAAGLAGMPQVGGTKNI
jgi:ABC-type hemin transport system substrate-binding protein